MIKRIFIIATESSGDLLGSKLMKELRSEALRRDIGEIEFVGIGGDKMKFEGLRAIYSIEDLSVMGFVEVLPKLRKLLFIIKDTKVNINQYKPDYLITIDSPDFNFRVTKAFADDKSFKKIHLVAPSVWAYREKRAENVAKIYDLLLTILPFEPPYFIKYNLKAKFIGHPIAEDAPDMKNKEILNKEYRDKHDISMDDIVICITAGSRISEVKKILPEFIGAVNLFAKNKKNITVVLPVTKKTAKLVKDLSINFQVNYLIFDQKNKNEAFYISDYALAKSGTNNLELSMYEIPFIVAYKVNFLTYLMLKMLIKVKYANLVNLILNKEVIKEMLQFKCNAKDIAFELTKLVNEEHQNQVVENKKVLEILGVGFKESPSLRAAKEILDL